MCAAYEAEHEATNRYKDTIEQYCPKAFAVTFIYLAFPPSHILRPAFDLTPRSTRVQIASPEVIFTSAWPPLQVVDRISSLLHNSLQSCCRLS